MKYKYSFRDAGRRHLVLDLPRELEYVSAILTEINREYLKIWYTEALDVVLNGEEEEVERGFEFYNSIIKKDFTYVHSIFEPELNCTIETSELRELIEIWWKEYVSFNQDRLDSILLTPHDIIWSIVYDQMGKETEKMGEGHRLDPKKYTELNTKLLADPITKKVEKEIQRDRTEGTYPQYAKYEQMLLQLKEKHALL